MSLNHGTLKHPVTLIAAAVGLVVPLVCYTLYWVFDIDFSVWTFVVWPTCIMLLAIVHPGLGAIVLQGMSIAANAVLYAAAGYVLELLIGLGRRV